MFQQMNTVYTEPPPQSTQIQPAESRTGLHVRTRPRHYNRCGSRRHSTSIDCMVFDGETRLTTWPTRKQAERHATGTPVVEKFPGGGFRVWRGAVSVNAATYEEAQAERKRKLYCVCNSFLRAEDFKRGARNSISQLLCCRCAALQDSASDSAPARPVELIYGFFKTKFSQDPKPFKITWREPLGLETGQFFKRTLDYLAFATEAEAIAEAARLNLLVKSCETAGCKGTVYPHEMEAREYAGTEDICTRCFERAFNKQLGLDTAAK
jgi:hypothetical protein